LLRIDISQPILDETMRVLREKFQWSGELLHFTRGKITGITNVVTPTETLNVIEYDPPDNRVLECAATAKSNFIVTEDKDLLRIGQYEGAPILTIREFIRVGLSVKRES
jgi:putative PIN family toxin of toxin-antitoxin system